MEYAAYFLFAILSLVGICWSLFGGMGTLLVFLGALVIGFATDFEKMTPVVLGVLFGLFLLGEAFEQISALVGAKMLGASKKAALGAVIGGFVGIILGLMTGIGILIFPIAGIFLGAFIVELIANKDIRQSFKSGLGGLLGRGAAIFSKITITLAMIAIVIIRGFFA